jgi:hypothetical protein
VRRWVLDIWRADFTYRRAMHFEVLRLEVVLDEDQRARSSRVTDIERPRP